MELLDRYLQEVRRHLPPGQQDDIIAEISDAIQSQAEEREEHLERPLTTDEQVALLKAFGHPKITASRYSPAQYLIGPSIYPFYWYTLRIVIAVVLSVELFGSFVAALIGPSPLPTFLSGVGLMWPSIFTVFGIVTLVFVLVEHFGAAKVLASRLGAQWNPRALAPAGRTEISRFSTLFEAIANISVLLFLLDVPFVRKTGTLVVAPIANSFAFLSLTPSWHMFFSFTIVAITVVVVQDVILLLYPAQTRLRAGALLIANILMIAGASAMLPLHNYVNVSNKVTAHAPHVASTLNQLAYVSFVILAIAWTVAALFNIRALFKRPGVPNYNISYNGIQ